MGTPGGARNLCTDPNAVNREILENDKWVGKPENDGMESSPEGVRYGIYVELSFGEIIGGLGHAQEGGFSEVGGDDLQTYGELPNG